MGLTSNRVSWCKTNSPHCRLWEAVWDPPLRVTPPEAWSYCAHTGPLQSARKEGCSERVDGSLVPSACPMHGVGDLGRKLAEAPRQRDVGPAVGSSLVCTWIEHRWHGLHVHTCQGQPAEPSVTMFSFYVLQKMKHRVEMRIYDKGQCPRYAEWQRFIHLLLCVCV